MKNSASFFFVYCQHGRQPGVKPKTQTSPTVVAGGGDDGRCGAERTPSTAAVELGPRVPSLAPSVGSPPWVGGVLPLHRSALCSRKRYGGMSKGRGSARWWRCGAAGGGAVAVGAWQFVADLLEAGAAGYPAAREGQRVLRRRRPASLAGIHLP
jgi:hypothetical protein